MKRKLDIFRLALLTVVALFILQNCAKKDDTVEQLPDTFEAVCFYDYDCDEGYICLGGACQKKYKDEVDSGVTGELNDP